MRAAFLSGVIAALATLLPLQALAETPQAETPSAARPVAKPMQPEAPQESPPPDEPPESAPSDDAAPAEEPPAEDPPTGATEPPDPSGPSLPESLRGSDLGHSACLLTLYLMGARYEEKPAITEENPDCGIARPIAVSQILPGVALDGAPLMRCETARQLAFWLNGTVLPASRFLPDSPRLSGVAAGSTYQCRGVVGAPSRAKVSEHALGNAFDIAAFTFSDGTTYPIAPRQDNGDLAEAFLAAIRGGACLYFTTVLGPGSNAAHDGHLHLDIKARQGGFRICQ